MPQENIAYVGSITYIYIYSKHIFSQNPNSRPAFFVFYFLLRTSIVYFALRILITNISICRSDFWNPSCDNRRRQSSFLFHTERPVYVTKWQVKPKPGRGEFFEAKWQTSQAKSQVEDILSRQSDESSQVDQAEESFSKQSDMSSQVKPSRPTKSTDQVEEGRGEESFFEAKTKKTHLHPESGEMRSALVVLREISLLNAHSGPVVSHRSLARGEIPASSPPNVEIHVQNLIECLRTVMIKLSVCLFVFVFVYLCVFCLFVPGMFCVCVCVFRCLYMCVRARRLYTKTRPDPCKKNTKKKHLL